jgi:FG-GAP-like repeat
LWLLLWKKDKAWGAKMRFEIRFLVCGFILFVLLATWGLAGSAPPAATQQKTPAPKQSLVGPASHGIAMGDFDGDGVQDFAVVNAADNTLSVLLGKSDGSFPGRFSYPAGAHPVLVAAGDLNGDGKLDLIVGTLKESGTSGGVAILLGNGDGTFQAAVDYPLGNSQVGALTIGDFNRDGKLDVVAVGNCLFCGREAVRQVFVLLGNGDGTLQAPLQYDAGPGANGVVSGDFNGDGTQDFAVTFSGDTSTRGGVAILLGNGDGTFQPPVTYATSNDPNAQAHSIVAADLNADGKLDLVVANANNAATASADIAVLLGNGDGSFQTHVNYQPGVPIASATSQATISQVVVTDSNGDGKLDLISVGDQVAVQLGNSDGTFDPALFYGASNSLATATADVASSSSSNFVAVGGGLTTLAKKPGAAPNSNGRAFLLTRVHSASVPETLFLINQGSAPVNLSGFQITGDFTQTNDCGPQLDAGASCNIAVTFRPQAPGIRTGALSIVESNAGTAIQLTALRAAAATDGSGESLVFSKTNLNFAPVTDRQTGPTPQTVNLFNVSPSIVTLNSIVLIGQNAGDFQVSMNAPGSCLVEGVILANSHCLISMTFTPSGVGERTAQLRVTDNVDPVPLLLPISGVGKAIGPIATLSTSSLSFGPVPDGTKPTMTLQLANSGDEPLNISATATTGQFSAANNCGSSLAPSAPCIFTVMFVAAFGSQSGTLTITDNAPGSPQTVTLTGIGEGIEFNKTSLVFPATPVGQTSAPRDVSVFSLGGNPIITGMLTGPNAGDFQVTSSSCGEFGFPGQIRVGDPCKLQITFIPTGTGLRTAQLVYIENGGAAGTLPITLPLSANGE